MAEDANKLIQAEIAKLASEQGLSRLAAAAVVQAKYTEIVRNLDLKKPAEKAKLPAMGALSDAAIAAYDTEKATGTGKVPVVNITEALKDSKLPIAEPTKSAEPFTISQNPDKTFSVKLSDKFSADHAFNLSLAVGAQTSSGFKIKSAEGPAAAFAEIEKYNKANDNRSGLAVLNEAMAENSVSGNVKTLQFTAAAAEKYEAGLIRQETERARKDLDNDPAIIASRENALKSQLSEAVSNADSKTAAEILDSRPDLVTSTHPAFGNRTLGELAARNGDPAIINTVASHGGYMSNIPATEARERLASLTDARLDAATTVAASEQKLADAETAARAYGESQDYEDEYLKQYVIDETSAERAAVAESKLVYDNAAIKADNAKGEVDTLIAAKTTQDEAILAGYDTGVKNEQDTPPLTDQQVEAIAAKDPEFGEKLQSQQDEYPYYVTARKLETAASTNDEAKLRGVIDESRDLASYDKNGFSGTMHALYHGNERFAGILQRNGAPAITDMRIRDAEDFASQHPGDAKATALVEALKTRQADQQTAAEINTSIANGNKQEVDAFLAMTPEADRERILNTPDENGLSPAAAAARLGTGNEIAKAIGADRGYVTRDDVTKVQGELKASLADAVSVNKAIDAAAKKLEDLEVNGYGDQSEMDSAVAELQSAQANAAVATTNGEAAEAAERNLITFKNDQDKRIAGDFTYEAARGNTEGLKLLANKFPEVTNKLDDKGQNAVSAAYLAGNTDAAMMLEEQHGARISQGQVDAAKAKLAEVAQRDPAGESIEHANADKFATTLNNRKSHQDYYAAKTPEEAGRVVDKNPAILNERDSNGYTPLMNAYIAGDKGKSEMLEGKNARVSNEDVAALKQRADDLAMSYQDNTQLTADIKKIEEGRAPIVAADAAAEAAKIAQQQAIDQGLGDDERALAAEGAAGGPILDADGNEVAAAGAAQADKFETPNLDNLIKNKETVSRIYQNPEVTKEIQDGLQRAGVAKIVSDGDFDSIKKPGEIARDPADNKILIRFSDQGHYGPQTDAAVKELQAHTKILAKDGNTGRATAIAIKEAASDPANPLVKNDGTLDTDRSKAVAKRVAEELTSDGNGITKRENKSLDPNRLEYDTATLKKMAEESKTAQVQ